MTDREIMQMALEALEVLTDNYDDNAVGIEIDAIIALRKRLARPEQEPVAFGTFKDNTASAYLFGKPAVEVENNDMEAAAREAIFLMAVDIGKGMK